MDLVSLSLKSSIEPVGILRLLRSEPAVPIPSQTHGEWNVGGEGIPLTVEGFTAKREKGDRYVSYDCSDASSCHGALSLVDLAAAAVFS